MLEATVYLGTLQSTGFGSPQAAQRRNEVMSLYVHEELLNHRPEISSWQSQSSCTATV